MAAFVFDLDMTLVDSSALDTFRSQRLWRDVWINLTKVKAFKVGKQAPHELPARVKEQGHDVAIVTSSPRWYAEELIKRFGILTDVLVAWDDTEQHKPAPEPIRKALEGLGVDADESYSVGDSRIDVQASYHAGVASIGAGWGVENFEELSTAAPDILLAKPGSLLQSDGLGRRGYFAEVLCNGETPKPHQGSILPCGRSPRRYALGRHFNTDDIRHAGSALATSNLTLKNKDGPALAFARALAAFADEIRWTPDCIVPVPPKPGQTRNRFDSLLQHVDSLLPDGIEVEPRGLKCVREVKGYKSLGAIERARAISGAFESRFNWNGCRILLLDDVLTTGETAKECARVLLADKASEVRVVAFGRDQERFVTKDCRLCGRPMRVRKNSTTGARFWGCSGYPSSCQHTEDIQGGD